MIPTRALPDDGAALARLDAACFTMRERWNQAQWQAELTAADRCVLVQREVTSCRGVVGAASFQHLFETVDLLRIMVEPQHRGRGLARQLALAGSAWALAQGAERMMLEVRHDNTEARRLYAGLGFRAIDRRPNYYGTGLHAEVMMAELTTTGVAHDHR